MIEDGKVRFAGVGDSGNLPTTAANQRVWLRWLSAAISFGLAAVLVTFTAA